MAPRGSKLHCHRTPNTFGGASPTWVAWCGGYFLYFLERWIQMAQLFHWHFITTLSLIFLFVSYVRTARAPTPYRNQEAAIYMRIRAILTWRFSFYHSTLFILRLTVILIFLFNIEAHSHFLRCALLPRCGALGGAAKPCFDEPC